MLTSVEYIRILKQTDLLKTKLEDDNGHLEVADKNLETKKSARKTKMRQLETLDRMLNQNNWEEAITLS